jgi:hypothetical protein
MSQERVKRDMTDDSPNMVTCTSKGKGRTYSNQELFNWLHRVGDDGEPPSWEELEEHPESPHPMTYRKRFGSLEEAISEASFDSDQDVVDGGGSGE